LIRKRIDVKEVVWNGTHWEFVDGFQSILLFHALPVVFDSVLKGVVLTIWLVGACNGAGLVDESMTCSE
jgi:hypothetical protein